MITAPPPPPGTVQSAPRAAANSGALAYSWAGQYVSGRRTTITATLPVTSPYLAAGADHTNAEVAAQGSHGDMVEVGWIVDRGDGGPAGPHLFATWWENGQMKSYRTFGSQPQGSAVFTVVQWQGSWVAKVGTHVLERFSDSLWPGRRFTGTVDQQVFAERQSVPGDGTAFTHGKFTWSNRGAVTYGGAVGHAGYFLIK